MIPKARNAALLLATSFMFGVANAEPLGSGLAAYYTFDEAQMTNLVPGSAVTGVTLSESGIVSGVTSGEFRHAGFGGYLDVNEGWARLDGSQNLEFENGNDFAICIWMRAEEWPVNDPAFVGNGSWSATTTPGTLLSFFSQGVACNYSYLENGEATRKRINGPAQLGKWIFYAISHTSDGKYSFYYSNADGSLTYDYCTMDGMKMHVVSPWMVRFRVGAGEWENVASQYVEDGSVPAPVEAPEIEGYASRAGTSGRTARRSPSTSPLPFPGTSS